MYITNAQKCVLFIVFLFLNFQTSFSQDLIQSIILKPYSKVYAVTNKVVIKNAILEDGKYTYKFKDKDILIEIKDGIYYEYHPKKEYIKAKIYWINEYEYKLTITDLQRREAPYKKGSQLTSKITKVNGTTYFYTSTFNNKTGNGSFKKVI